MPRSRHRVFHLIAAAILVASSGCTADLDLGVPDAWAFPLEHAEVTYGTDGMVASTDRVASEIGVEVLRRGGNAVDAAVAVHFALSVVNPEAGNIGGGGFMVVRTADGQTATLDFREMAPAAATPNMYLDEQGALTDRSRFGHLAAGVPGSVAGMWDAHQRYGSLDWLDLVQPAVNLAEGLVVHERLAHSLGRYEQRLRQHPSTEAIFLPDGYAPRVGDRLVQRDLAETLRRIARDGRDGFYAGTTAELVELEMNRGGGIITREDLARYETLWREPIEFSYRGHTLISMPPPSSGGAALANILHQLEGFDVEALGYLSREHVHMWAEVVKRAFVDRNTYFADADYAEVPTERMISAAYAATRRNEFRMDRATASRDVLPGLGPVPSGTEALAHRESGETTHYSVVDGDGNAVAVTTTLNSLYGSLVTVSGAGFLLNNEMDDFTTLEGAPNQFGLIQSALNAIVPGKRMVSCMTPTIVLDSDGQVMLVTGSPGGPTIITTVAQMISNIVDFGMDVGSATSAPRLHHQHVPDVLRYERDGLQHDVVARLRALGHVVEARPGYSGDAQSIFRLPDGTLAGVADPRRGGAALAVRGARRPV